MASKGRTKKRTLPTWMTTMHNQIKQKKLGDECNGEGRADRREQNTHSKALSTLHESQAETKNSKCAGELISDAMTFVKVPSNVTYTFQTADCACICEEIMSSFKEECKIPVGFDMEWPVTFKQGSINKTALVQMYFSNNNQCYLFQVCGMNPFPKQLVRLICHEHILLVGLNIESDLWKLERDYDIRVKPLLDRGSVIDVGKLANRKLKSCQSWDLNGLCKNALGMQLKKDHEIRCSNWTTIPLTEKQVSYSSTDAYAGFLLYQKLAGL